MIRLFHESDWSDQASRAVQDVMDTRLAEDRECSVMLTGGRCAERFYTAWAKLLPTRTVGDVRFYFGDERCVPPDHSESNYGMVVKTLFARGIPEGCTIFRMEADDVDREAAALRYAKALPDSIDILLLGVGEDGHIASLFPKSPALLEFHRRVVLVSSPKPPHERLTITPPVIAQAKYIFVLAAGRAKAQVLVKALRQESNVAAMPVRMVLDATWLLDTSLLKEVH